LNPFALPAETNVRFMLIVVAAFALILNVSGAIIQQLVIKRFLPGNANDPLASFPEMTSATVTQAQIISVWGSVVFAALMTLFIPLISLGGLFLLTTFYYRKFPDNLKRKLQLVPLQVEKQAVLQRAILDLAARAGVAPLPPVLLGPAKAQDGQAFGSANQPLLRLGKNIQVLRVKKRGRFDAVVLHEFGHIVNRDISRAYFSNAVWNAFLIILPLLTFIRLLLYFIDQIIIRGGLVLDYLLPMAISFTVTTFIVLFSILAFVAVMEFARRGAVRVREMYADWRAVQWGARESLEEILAENLEHPRRSFFQRLLLFHPPEKDRLQVIRDPSLLFAHQPDLSLFVGFLFGSVSTGLMTLIYQVHFLFYVLLDVSTLTLDLEFMLESQGVSTLFSDLAILTYSMVDLGFILLYMLLPFLFVLSAGLIVGTVGLQAIREALADSALRRQRLSGYWKLVIPALLLPVGFELGIWMSPYDSITVIPSFLTDTQTGFVLLPVWFLFTAALTFTGLVYLRFFARRILAALPGTKPPRMALLVLLLTGSVGFVLLYLPAAIGRAWLMDLTVDLSAWVAWIPLALLGFVGIWISTWVAYRLLVLFRDARCTTCGQRISQSRLVGSFCSNCGRALASWLWTGYR
jgi:Zn-dependent protease with chaperone function